MRRVVALSLVVIAGACDAGPAAEQSTQSALEEEERDYFAIHVGGVCSTGWEGGKGDGELGTFDGITSIDADVNQQNTMAEATDDLARVFDQYCTGNGWCYVLTYSNGGATASRTLALFGERWNIVWVLSAASNEGGSEIGGTGWLGEVFGGCQLAGHIGTTDHRSGWNHNDTAGTTFYMTGGYASMAPWLQSSVLPGEDDGAVAYHSAGGWNDTYRTSTLCGGDGAHWDNHVIAWTCDGYDLNHIEMKGKAVCQAGGC